MMGVAIKDRALDERGVGGNGVGEGSHSIFTNMVVDQPCGTEIWTSLGDDGGVGRGGGKKSRPRMQNKWTSKFRGAAYLKT